MVKSVIYKTVWCEVGLQMEDIGATDFREDKLKPILGYTMVRLDNWQIFSKG